MNATASALVGVPISVARPPIVAAVGHRTARSRPRSCAARRPPARIRRNQRRDRHRHRQHHQRGRGVRDPHADERGGRHHPEHQATGARARAQDDEVRNAPVQLPALERQREQAAAEDQENGRAAVAMPGPFHGHDAEQRSRREGQHGRGRDRQGLGRPPHGHQGGERRRAPRRRREVPRAPATAAAARTGRGPARGRCAAPGCGGGVRTWGRI